jgi:uncharacterized membrane protein
MRRLHMEGDSMDEGMIAVCERNLTQKDFEDCMKALDDQSLVIKFIVRAAILLTAAFIVIRMVMFLMGFGGGQGWMRGNIFAVIGCVLFLLFDHFNQTEAQKQYRIYTALNEENRQYLFNKDSVLSYENGAMTKHLYSDIKSVHEKDDMFILLLPDDIILFGKKSNFSTGSWETVKTAINAVKNLA